MEKPENLIKYVLLLAACAVFRLAQVIPNAEPIMFTTLPAAKKFGAKAAFAFAFIAMASFDFVSGRVGMWTAYTALAYGAVGFFAGKYLAGRGATRWNFLKYSVAGTIAFDIVTALIFGWQFGQTVEATLIGQVPFTAYHLLGNVVLVTAFAPLLYKHVLENEALSLSRVLVNLGIAAPAPVPARKRKMM